jgi:hypothetical protein
LVVFGRYSLLSGDAVQTQLSANSLIDFGIKLAF